MQTDNSEMKKKTIKTMKGKKAFFYLSRCSYISRYEGC